MTGNHHLQGKMQRSLEPHFRLVTVQTANMGNPPLLNPETAALQYQEDFPINAKVSLLQLPEARDTRSRSTTYREPLTLSLSNCKQMEKLLKFSMPAYPCAVGTQHSPLSQNRCTFFPNVSHKFPKMQRFPKVPQHLICFPNSLLQASLELQFKTQSPFHLPYLRDALAASRAQKKIIAKKKK